MTTSRHGSLTWHNDLAMGHDETPPIEYGGDYWAEYQRRDQTAIGQAITAARVALVMRHTSRKPCDIGIGAGAFVMASGGTGYDINPIAVQWLRERNLFLNPYQSYPGCLTFWDSLEHIPDPVALLSRLSVGDLAFVSIPVFKDMAHCLASKHYKPGEHIWYWTHEGFLEYMARLRFFCLEHNDIESRWRDGVMSYAFVKR